MMRDDERIDREIALYILWAVANLSGPINVHYKSARSVSCPNFAASVS